MLALVAIAVALAALSIGVLLGLIVTVLFARTLAEIHSRPQNHETEYDELDVKDCLDPDDLIAIRQLLRAQGRMRDGWAEADDSGRRFIWTDLHNKGDAVAERFHDRIAELNHAAAQLEDGALATSLTDDADEHEGAGV